MCVCKTLALKFSKVYMLLTFENGIMEFCLMVEASDHVYVLHVSIPVVMTSRIWRWPDGVNIFTPAVRHIHVKRYLGPIKTNYQKREKFHTENFHDIYIYIYIYIYLHIYCCGNKVNSDKMGRACGTHGRKRNVKRFLVGKLFKKKPFGVP